MAIVKVATSGTLALNEGMVALRKAGRKIYQFGFGESPFPTPRRVQHALADTTARKDYTAVAGLPELRRKIADFHQEVDGLPIGAEQVLVAPGSKPLLFNIMQAFEPGNVFIPAPAWVSYAQHAALAGHRVYRVATTYAERWRLTPAALEDAICRYSQPGADKLLILNYPGNPDGLTYSRGELSQLADVLRRRGVWVISDEIYGLLHHRGRHVSLATLYPERTLVTTGLSKWCGAGGWRLGAAILPAGADDLRAAMIGLGSEVYSCAPTPIQAAALSAYQLDSETMESLWAQRLILSQYGAILRIALVEAGILARAPEGGFYMLCDFSPHAESLATRGIHSDIALCDRLLAETGVALLAGSNFGMPPEALTARLAYVDFDGAAALRAVQNNGDFLAFADNMLEGVLTLDKWLN